MHMTAAAYTKYRAVFRRPYLGCEYRNGTTIGGQYRGKSQARLPGPQVRLLGSRRCLAARNRPAGVLCEPWHILTILYLGIPLSLLRISISKPYS